MVYTLSLHDALPIFGMAESLNVAHNVRFLGSRDDVPDIIRALDVLVVNSHEEPFGLTVLEGLASGMATLSTAVGGTPEMITHGVNGFLTARNDHVSLVSALLTLLRDPQLREQLGANARRDAVARFSISRFIQEVNSLYRAVSNTSEIPFQKTIGGLEVKLSAD